MVILSFLYFKRVSSKNFACLRGYLKRMFRSRIEQHCLIPSRVPSFFIDKKIPNQHHAAGGMRLCFLIR